MAERIVSPGVFTQERDQTFLAQGIEEIGAAFVGPTTKGPAFIPTSVQGIDGFVTAFGEPDGTSYMGYTVKNYLQEAGTATVVRVLGLAGYSTTVGTVYATGSGGSRVLAIIHSTTNGASLTNISGSGTGASFSLSISGSASSSLYSGLNAVESSSNFIGSVIGSNARIDSSPGYVYAVFPDAIAQAGGTVTVYAQTSSLNLATEYDNASTPWIKSQDFGGTKHNLFKVHTLGDGTVANKNIKISITGISPSTNPDSVYGTFSLLVRDFNDIDSELNVLEQFNNLNLDPTSPNYIARVIGNSVPTYNSDTGLVSYEGDYPNVSRYIRVQMSEDTIPGTAVPYGFAALSAVFSEGTVATGSYVTSRWTSGSVSGYVAGAVGPSTAYYGFNFASTTAKSYLGPVPSGAATVGSEFNIDDITSLEVDGVLIDIDTKSHTSYRRFSVPFQGGFDGLNPNRTIALGADIQATNTQGFNLQNSLTSGSVEYKRALNQLSNADAVDFNLLVIPGVIYSQHTYIAQSAIDLCAARGDCFYIADLDTLNATIDSVTQYAEALDTNYAAAYYPWVRVLDDITGTFIWAPPSVVLPEVYAYSDKVGAEWFAPAGLNRGGIPGAIGVKTRLTQAQRDELYESKVNPIAQFPGQGICVWGQKTLQRRASALDRVNVRRLLITVKKYIASSARYLVFEQNTEATRNRFLNIVNPYLASIQQRSGLTAFKVVMDDTNNTPDIIDRNILVGAIYLQPTRTAEFIKLDFNILPTGATFDTI